MEQEEFKSLKEVKDKDYSYINCYKGEDFIFFVEPNFYTQLTFLKEAYKNEYSKIVETIIDIAKRNKKVIFVGDFENPAVFKEGFIYREIDDVLNELKITFDIKINPKSDWTD